VRDRWFPVLLTVCLAAALVFLTLPIVAIFVRSSPGDLIDSLGQPEARDALWLSLRTTGAAISGAKCTLGRPSASPGGILRAICCRSIAIRPRLSSD